MREILLSATVLLCAVLLIRGVLKDHIPAGARYGLWLLVALRLLVPVELGASPVSVANWTAGARQVQSPLSALTGGPSSGPAEPDHLPPVGGKALDGGTEGLSPVGGEALDGLTDGPPSGLAEADPLSPVGEKVLSGEAPAQFAGVGNGPAQSGIAGQLPTEGGASGGGEGPSQSASLTAPPEGEPWSWGVLLGVIWLIGALGMAGWFALSNLRLWGRLRRARRPFPVEGCPIPVYRADFLPSPCLAGVFRPAVYLNRTAAEEPERLKYVLAHELAHRRHGDHVWGLIRAVCLCLWWFHPLVWIGAVCSKRDCELFCDASAVKALGEAERLAYGRTLVEMVAAGRPGPGELLAVSTAMTEGVGQIKERVIRVSVKRKMKKTAVGLTVCLALLAGICTFTGAVERSAPTQAPFRVEAVPGLTARDLEVTDDVSIPDFPWTGTQAGYSREVAMRFLAEYGKRLYGLPQGSPWRAADVAVLGTGYEWTGDGFLTDPGLGAWGQEPYKKGSVREVWETGALAVKPAGGLEAVAALYNGGLPRGTGAYADYALMELVCSLKLEDDGRWYAHGNGAYSLALRANTTPPGEEGDWTDEQIERWGLDYKTGAAVAGDDRAAWEAAGRRWAESYIRQHLTAPDNGSPAKADDVKLTAMELKGWTPSDRPTALYFHLEYQFRPVWGAKAGSRFISRMDDNYVGASWSKDSEYVTVTAAVTLERTEEDGTIWWNGLDYQGQYAQNYANGMDLSYPLAVPAAAGKAVSGIDPVGVSVTFPAGTDETRQRYAVFGLWAAEFGQQFYRLPENHPLYCDSVEVNYPNTLTPTQITSSGATRTVLGAEGEVGLRLRPVNGQQGAAKALESDRTFVFAPSTNGRDEYDGKIDANWRVFLERGYNADGSVTWTCTQGRPAQNSGRAEPETTQALALPYHVEAKPGLSLPTLDGDLIWVPDDGKGDLAARWAVQFGQQFYALPNGAAWKASDVMVYDAGEYVGLAIRPAGGLEALEGQYPQGYPMALGKGELEGYALLQYDLSFRRETVDLFGTQPVWVKDRGGIQWIPGVPEVGSEEWQEAMEHHWKRFQAGNYSWFSVYSNELGDPEAAGRAWAERFLDGLLGDLMWGGGSRRSGSGSPLQADDVKLLELTQTGTGTVDGEQSVTFTFRYALRPVWGMEIAKACAPDISEGTGELAGYAVRTATLELRFQPGKPAEQDGYGYQRTPEGMWYCAGMTY